MPYTLLSAYSRTNTESGLVFCGERAGKHIATLRVFYARLGYVHPIMKPNGHGINYKLHIADLWMPADKNETEIEIEFVRSSTIPSG